LPIEKIESFESFFETKKKDGTIQKSKRITHLFLVRLPDGEEFNLKVNEMKNEMGGSEDNHQGYRWVTPGELVKYAVSFEENEVTGKQFHPLSRNSRYIKKLLSSTGYIE